MKNQFCSNQNIKLLNIWKKKLKEQDLFFSIKKFL